jgi:Dockerin type I domain
MDSDVTETTPWDIFRIPRNVNAAATDTGSGVPALDMGCSEYQIWCVGDFNRDGIVDGADTTAFVTAYSAQDPSADLNNDGSWNGTDVSIFNNSISTGC